MEGGKSSSALTIQACEEQLLRSHIMFVAAGKTDLTDEQLVDLLLSAFPQSYSACDRNLLTERVAKVTPLRRRGDDAVDEPIPEANKRQKVDETLNASAQNVVLPLSDASSSSVPSSTEVGQSESDEIDGGRRELTENRVGRWRDGTGDNCPMFKDLYGSSIYKKMLEELKRELILPLHQLKLLRHFGVEPTARILLCGPPGCGKTMLARAIANEAGVPFCEISAAELVSGVSGEPNENIREIFSTAHRRAPSIVFIDEIDAMASIEKSLQKVVEPRIVKELITCIDKLDRLIKPVNHDAVAESSNSRPGYVLVIGATNSPDALDPALRRSFDREIAIAAPDEKARLAILSALTRNLKVEVGFDLLKIARCTLGFVPGDLVALVKEAGKSAVTRTVNGRISQSNKEQSVKVPLKDCYSQLISGEDLENLSITMDDIWDASYVVLPSSKMEGFSTTPNAKWDDVVGLQLLKSEFERHIIKPVKFPELYKDLRGEVKVKTKFFLYGPPGCGKTFVVKALANETGANFMHIKARQLSYYGDYSGRVVQNLFSYARTHSPCILFFDELIGDEDTGPNPDIRQLVSEVGDTVGDMSRVYVIGATNRIKVGELFPLIRKQFDKILCVPLPSPKERVAMMKLLTRDKPIDADVDLVFLGKDCNTERYNGNDLAYVIREAALIAIDRGGGCGGPWTITDADFKTAMEKTLHCNEVTHHENKKYGRYFKLC